jgi:hypothetical protein
MIMYKLEYIFIGSLENETKKSSRIKDMRRKNWEKLGCHSGRQKHGSA